MNCKDVRCPTLTSSSSLCFCLTGDGGVGWGLGAGGSCHENFVHFVSKVPFTESVFYLFTIFTVQSL